MITAGIDMGSRSVKVVLLEEINVEGKPTFAVKKAHLMMPGDLDADVEEARPDQDADDEPQRDLRTALRILARIVAVALQQVSPDPDAEEDPAGHQGAERAHREVEPGKAEQDGVHRGRSS